MSLSRMPDITTFTTSAPVNSMTKNDAEADGHKSHKHHKDKKAKGDDLDPKKPVLEGMQTFSIFPDQNRYSSATNEMIKNIENP